MCVWVDASVQILCIICMHACEHLLLSVCMSVCICSMCALVSACMHVKHVYLDELYFCGCVILCVCVCVC